MGFKTLDEGAKLRTSDPGLKVKQRERYSANPEKQLERKIPGTSPRLLWVVASKIERAGRGLDPFEGGLVQYVVAVVAGLVLAEVATLITTIYLHRVLSHKAIRLHPALTMFMRLGTWMLTSISPREWVAVHRKHHNFSDVR